MTAVNLELPEQTSNHSNDANDTSHLTPDGTIFVSEQDQFLLVPTTPAFSQASSNKSTKSNVSDENGSSDFDETQLGLSLIKIGGNNITTPHPNTTELLDDIQYEELTKLKFELDTAKQELSEMSQSHSDQIDHFQRMLKKVKAEGEMVGVIKHRKKQSRIQMNYESELEQINDKLKQTQTTHVSELKQIKKSELKYKLEIKLKDQKISALTNETESLQKQISELKKTHEKNINNLRKEYDEQMEKEINKRITQISEIKQQKNNEIKILNKQQNTINVEMEQDDKDKVINTLNEEIKRLERRYEEEQDMFFKHSEMIDYKLERETKDKKRLEKKLLEKQFEHENDIQIANDKLKHVKDLLTKQNEINIHLQNNLVVLNEQNKRYKEMENEYKLVAENIENDYQQMNANIETLKNTAQEKENELMEVKQYLNQKESENKKLKTNVRSHNNTIMQLESIVQELKESEEKFDDKKKQIQNLNVKINDVILNTPSVDKTPAGNFEFNMDEKDENKGVHHGYTISYLSNTVDDQLQIKHVNELENIKNEYNKLINKMKKEHERTRDRLKDAEMSKVVCLKNFTVAIDQMRAQVRKQCKLFRGINIHELLEDDNFVIA